MYLDSAKKTEIFTQYGKSATDTGSVESQVALFTFRIKHLTEHLKKNHKDHKTARSLTMLVGKRRALLAYLKDQDITRYRALIKALGLRKESQGFYHESCLSTEAGIRDSNSPSEIIFQTGCFSFHAYMTHPASGKT